MNEVEPQNFIKINKETQDEANYAVEEDKHDSTPAFSIAKPPKLEIEHLLITEKLAKSRILTAKHPKSQA